MKTANNNQIFILKKFENCLKADKSYACNKMCKKSNLPKPAVEVCPKLKPVEAAGLAPNNPPEVCGWPPNVRPVLLVGWPNPAGLG